MSKVNILFILLLVLLFQQYQTKVLHKLPKVNHSNKQSRDFVEWMKTVPTDVQFGNGLKRLIININPSLGQQQGDEFTAQINEAAQNFPDFCNSGDESKDKQEFAAFLTIVGAETSFSTSANFPQEIENGCPNCDACSYNSVGKECTDDPKKQYFGRGPLQLSWNFNYGDYSEFLYGDRDVLLNDPDKAIESGAAAWSSAIWFWMVQHEFGGWCMPQAAWPSFDYCDSKCFDGPNSCSESVCTSSHWIPRSKSSCHDAMQGSGGIGTVISIINGGYDCCPSSSYGRSYGHTSYRIWWFQDIYHVWTDQFATALNPVPIKNCPLAVGTNCNAMTTGTCWNQCCSLQ